MNATRTKKTEAVDPAAPDPKAAEAIGRALEAHYASLVQAPLPDKFLELLARLERETGFPERKGSAMPSTSFKDELLAEIRNLRAFAISLSGSVSLADDLVQESLLRAWSNSEKFQPGTSLRAWLFTILRNIYYSNYRKRSREVQDSDGFYARRLTVPGDQESHLDLEDFRNAMTKLPAEQREVLTLIGASGLSYEEAAVVCQVGIGTIKSRLSRARAKLVELLELDEAASAAGRAQGSARGLALRASPFAQDQRDRAALKADTSTRGGAGFSTIGQSLHSARLGSPRDFPV